MKGIIFDIERFTLHDGPGIRSTVFVKGCPLSCPWCHNPEGRVKNINLWYFKNKCIQCGKCIEVCPTKSLAFSGTSETQSIVIDHKKCNRCGDCIAACPSRALAFDGRIIDSSEVVNELLKDRIFYETSGGGITVSGGEPLAQYSFSLEIIKQCKEQGLHTAIETCLYTRQDIIREFMDVVDLFIVDLKLADSKLHKEYTGVGNEVIRSNFEMLAGNKANILVRIPLIPGYTAFKENIQRIGTYAASINSSIPIELMNYNDLAESKYRLMGEEFKLESGLKPFALSELEYFNDILRNSGVNNIIGS